MLLERLESRQVMDGVIISEFLAVNDGGITDEDGVRNDWIELLNTGTEDVDLDGWHLTDTKDDLNQWTFPDVIIPAGDTLLVWASNNDRTSGELHTNFRLGQGGEYLALLRPDNTVEFEYDPFPPQISNYSYGVPSTNAVTTLVAGQCRGEVAFADQWQPRRQCDFTADVDRPRL